MLIYGRKLTLFQTVFNGNKFSVAVYITIISLHLDYINLESLIHCIFQIVGGGEMGSLPGPVICRIAHVKQVGISKAVLLESGLQVSKRRYRRNAKVGPLIHHSHVGTCKKVTCSLGSSSNDNGSMAENFNENDGEYVNSSVIEAVEVKSGADGFIVKMRDGRHLRCIHNNHQGGYLPEYAPHPAIVLKMEDGSNLLLPIIVLEMPCLMLMAAVRNIQSARPTPYQIIKEMIEKMGYAVKLVRVTKRVHEAYFARLYLTKVNNESEIVSFDIRPSDAINIAVRCQVPIQVNKYLAYNDGMKIVEPAKHIAQAPLSNGLLVTELDRPDGQPCVETEEFDLVRNMLIAAVEERYRDAAQWRDMLTQFRTKRQNWT